MTMDFKLEIGELESVIGWFHFMLEDIPECMNLFPVGFEQPIGYAQMVPVMAKGGTLVYLVRMT